MAMDIDKMIKDLDSYFENTPKEHFAKVWDKVKAYEAYGPEVSEFLKAGQGDDAWETADYASYHPATFSKTTPHTVLK